MADIASIRTSRTEVNESHDGTILQVAAAGILAILLLMVIMSPSGSGPGLEHVPTLFGL